MAVAATLQVHFRVDASLQIGSGHVMRCLALAEALRGLGACCTFVCRSHVGHLLELITSRGFGARALSAGETRIAVKTGDQPTHYQWLDADWQEDAEQTLQIFGEVGRVDWLVVDHYALDVQWEQRVRNAVGGLLVIDDLADRPHDCDLLLDQNLGRTDGHYGSFLPTSARTLLGPGYALLRPEFAQWRGHSLERRASPRLRSLLISMGGVDPANATGKILAALKNAALPEELQITVVMGVHAPWRELIERQCLNMPWPSRVLAGVNHMAQLMAESDLAIGAAGGTAWERCAVGLPTIVLPIAENQVFGARALQSAGAAILVSISDDFERQLHEAIEQTLQPGTLSEMSRASAILADGEGVSRVVKEVFGLYGK